MTHDEFQEKIWQRINRARSEIEHAMCEAGKVDRCLDDKLHDIRDAICGAQARCADLTKIGEKK